MIVTAEALIGRDRELVLFADVVVAARAGTPRVVLVRGPRGIGKSALVDAALADPSAGPGTVLRTTCLPGTAAFGTACALLASVSGGDLFRRELLALRSLGDHCAGEDRSLVRSIMHRLHQVVVNTTGRAGGLVLVLDDVQHCDASSLRWLDFTLRRAAELPLLVVLALRTEALTSVRSLPAGLLELHSGLVLDLGPLAHDDAVVLAADALGSGTETGFAEQCVRVADGNPGVLLRLIEVLNGRRVRPVNGEASRVAAFGRLAALRDMLAVLSHTEHALAVARAVGALGTTDAELVATLAGVPVAHVQVVVELLRSNDFLDESGLAVQVVAPVLDGLSARQREELRGRAAWLLSVAGYPAGQVAEQLLPLPEQPEPWMLDILREAARNASFSARRRYLFALYRSDPHDPQIRVDLAAAVGREDPERALELLREALALTGNVRERASVVVKLAAAGLATGRAPEVLELVDAALAELGSAGGADHAAHKDLVRGLTASRIIGGLADVSTIGATLKSAGVATFTDLGTAGETVAERLLAAARAALVTARGEQAHLALEYASTAAGPVTSRQSVISSFVSALVCHLAGERITALSILGRLVEERSTENDHRGESTALSLRALIRAESDELSGAYADARRAVELSGGTGRPDSVAPRVALATVLALRDEVDMAALVLGEPTTCGVWEHHEYLMTRGQIRWAQADIPGAIDDLTACGDSLREAGIANPSFAPWWLDLARLLVEVGRADEAVELVEHGAKLARRWRTRHALGLVRLAQGSIAHGDQASALLCEAVELLAATADRVRQVEAEHLLGLALARGGDLRGGRARLRHAVDLAVRWGQRAHASWARADLEGLGGRMGRRDAVLTGSLTPSERRVVAMAASGANNREIAEALVVSLRTVEIHLTSAYRKLGVRGRRQLAEALTAHTGSQA
ncbi:helix-turn-helix transcriptional regulator [Lentzea aerocolonigenes]|uniref:helix-turn-helix transcriptional regulator n=1 Tax=Lentzea aerocolonigenes TaxID=68170 RepID=UPI000ADBAC4F|nr:LuxR family transcriptional regulator [Lentzea aerocolonigenes]MCP2242184.1 regulatory protein, luxR family [Lentzea aerocolonigenes]